MDIVATFDQKADDGDSVRDVEKDDAGRDHAVERRVAAQIEQAQDGDDDAADEMRSERDVDAGVDVAEEFGEGESTVASKRPAQATLPRMARN